MSEDKGAEIRSLDYERRLRAYPRQEAKPPVPAAPVSIEDRLAAAERELISLNTKMWEMNRLVLKLVYASISGRSFAQGVENPQAHGQKETGA